MTITMAAPVVAWGAVSLVVLGSLALWARARARRRGTPSARARHVRHSQPMLRFRRTQPGSNDWQPLRVTVRELRVRGLRHWPEAPGVYVPEDASLHCRQCVTDPRTRASIVDRRDDGEQVLVLFGGSDEGAMVDHVCATHTGENEPVPLDAPARSA